MTEIFKSHRVVIQNIHIKKNAAQFYFLSGNECREAAQALSVGKIVKWDHADFNFSYRSFSCTARSSSMNYNSIGHGTELSYAITK